jgi:hypothetical protein
MAAQKRQLPPPRVAITSPWKPRETPEIKISVAYKALCFSAIQPGRFGDAKSPPVFERS